MMFSMEHVVIFVCEEEGRGGVSDVHDRRGDAVGSCMGFSFSSISPYALSVCVCLCGCVCIDVLCERRE